MRYFRWGKRSDRPNDETRRATGPQHPLFAVLEAEDRRTLRYQFTIFAFAALSVGSLLQLSDCRARDAPARLTACPPGKFPNLEGDCVVQPKLSSTQSCTTDTLKTAACECDGGRAVDDHGLCVLPPRRSDRCDIASGILTKCEKKRGGKSSTECSATEIFKSSALVDQDVEALLASFPETITIHFGENQPRTTAPNAALVSDLAAMKSTIEGSGYIFLLGRADSSSGSATDNDKMAQRRMKLARIALLEASGLKGADRDRLDRRIIDFGLGSNLTLDVERFSKLYTRTLDSGDPRVTQILNDGLARLRNDALSPTERTNLESAVNRSVQVIFVDPSCNDGAFLR